MQADAGRLEFQRIFSDHGKEMQAAVQVHALDVLRFGTEGEYRGDP